MRHFSYFDWKLRKYQKLYLLNVSPESTKCDTNRTITIKSHIFKSFRTKKSTLKGSWRIHYRKRCYLSNYYAQEKKFEIGHSIAKWKNHISNYNSTGSTVDGFHSKSNAYYIKKRGEKKYYEKSLCIKSSSLYYVSFCRHKI